MRNRSPEPQREERTTSREQIRGVPGDPGWGGGYTVAWRGGGESPRGGEPEPEGEE